MPFRMMLNGAVAPGSVGNATLLNALAERVSAVQPPASGPSVGLSRSHSGLASDLLSSVDANSRFNEDSAAFHGARADALAYEIAADGVDTDDEMQKLLLIEQVYAANARVIQTVDQLIQHLLEL